MKNIGFIYTSDQRLEDIITANELSADEEYLIRIHTCIHSFETIIPFVNKIHSYFPKAKIIGSSTSGVIFSGKLMTDCCLVSITEFKNSKVETMVRPLIDENGNYLDGETIADNMTENAINENTKFMVTFVSGHFLKIDDYVERINTVHPRLQMIGCVANTPETPLINTKKLDSFVFTENGVYQHSVAAAIVNSEILSVNSDVVYVTEPVGEIHTITGADGYIIRSIDGVDAIEWYEQQLGIDFENMENSSYATLLFPLVKTNRSNVPWVVFYAPKEQAKTIFPNEDNAVLYAINEAKIGDTVKISYASVQNTIDVCEKVCDNLNAHPSEVLIGYSCVSRQDMFTNCAKWELMPFAKTNMCGALGAGEITNIKGVNRFSTLSFGIAALSESECRMKIDKDLLSENLGELINDNENVINYLITHSGSDKVISAHHEIEKKLFVDTESGLDTINKYLYDYSIGNINKICMVTIKNESLIKAFMSEKEFFDCLNRFNHNIINYIGNSHYNFYVYKETSLIITSNSKITNEDFINKMLQLQSSLLEFKFLNYVPVCEFSVVMDEDDMIKKAELTLVKMRSKHTCFLNYTPDLGLEQFNAQKMKMIMILNNAISNNGVVPYFQGIRDNSRGNIHMYEALMRLEDSSGNVYTPFHFMDIAKEYGYYADISIIMINKVLNIFQNRNENVTINMTISDVYNYKIVHSILEFLKNTPHPENFIFELTETEEVEDYQVIFEFVQRVHEHGGKIAIDDFGSGFSNIVHIFKIPADYIKIDGEIIKNITSDVYAREFLEMISNWSKKHSKEIIAEFVENNNIQRIVESHGIRFSQGYLYSRPSKIFLQ